jgi:hypothetical protein
LTSLPSAFCEVELEATGHHPFPAYVIQLSSFVIFVEQRSWQNFLGDAASSEADGIDQSHYPDCWMESSIGAASRTPRGQETIAKMIVRSGPGSFTVTFPDLPNRSFTVTTSDIRNLGLQDSALWAGVLEAAALQRFPQTKVENGIKSVVQREGFTADIQVGLKSMTGFSQPSIIDVGSTSNSGIASTLSENQRLQLPTVIGSKPQKEMPDPRHPILVPTHAYAVLGFDKAKENVMIRNPWGRNTSPKFPDLPQPGQTKNGIHDVGGGVLLIPLRELKSYFRYLSWAPFQRT